MSSNSEFKVKFSLNTTFNQPMLDYSKVENNIFSGLHGIKAPKTLKFFFFPQYFFCTLFSFCRSLFQWQSNPPTINPLNLSPSQILILSNLPNINYPTP
jgi:hypothetical protein